MKDLVTYAVQAALDAGAEYADARIVETDSESLVVQNGEVEEVRKNYRLGIGVRVIAQGAWGFSSCGSLNRSDIQQTASESVSIARASASVNTERIKLVPGKAYQKTWVGSCKVDPRNISLDQKISYLLDCDKEMKSVPGVKIRKGNMNFIWTHMLFANSDGSMIDQQYPVSGIGIEAIAMKDDDMQIRSYPNCIEGQVEGRGYEIIDRWKPVDHAGRIAEEVVALLNAPPCPEGNKTIIIDSTQLALQIHESCGHAVELDRVLGSEINDYGTSFLTLDKLGSFVYGSPLVNLVSDPTIEGGLGSFAFDDEGVRATRSYLVKEGMFTGYLTSRETAAQIGIEESNASMRAEHFNRVPLIRMSNLNLEPGTTPLEQLIGETDDGLYLSVNKSFSIDDRRWQFQFGTEIGWLIKKGKFAGMVKNPVYSGITPQFWQACDGIADKNSWVLWGIPNCGKGQPDQGARVSHGCSPSRFHSVKVGTIHE